MLISGFAKLWQRLAKANDLVKLFSLLAFGKFWMVEVLDAASSVDPDSLQRAVRRWRNTNESPRRRHDEQPYSFQRLFIGQLPFLKVNVVEAFRFGTLTLEPFRASSLFDRR